MEIVASLYSPCCCGPLSSHSPWIQRSWADGSRRNRHRVPHRSVRRYATLGAEQGVTPEARRARGCNLFRHFADDGRTGILTMFISQMVFVNHCGANYTPERLSAWCCLEHTPQHISHCRVGDGDCLSEQASRDCYTETLFPVPKSTLQHQMQRTCHKLGLEGLSLHSFRHTFGTRLGEAGASAHVIANNAVYCRRVRSASRGLGRRISPLAATAIRLHPRRGSGGDFNRWRRATHEAGCRMAGGRYER